MIAASEAAGATVNFLGDSVTVLLPANRAIAVRALGAVRSAEARTQPLVGQPLLRMAEAAAVREMGQVRFDRLFEAGANAGPQRVFEEVRGVLLASARPDRRHGVHRLRGAFGEFTARELEVLPLLSEARSDGEIRDDARHQPQNRERARGEHQEQARRRNADGGSAARPRASRGDTGRLEAAMDATVTSSVCADRHLPDRQRRLFLENVGDERHLRIEVASLASCELVQWLHRDLDAPA